MYIVYKYTSPSNKSYIGITRQTQKNRAGNNGYKYERCPAFWKAIQKYGFENFSYEELETNLDEKTAKEKEKEYIKKFNTQKNGYNISGGGDGFTIYDSNEIMDLWNRGFSTKEIEAILGGGHETIQQTLTKNNITLEERIARGRKETTDKYLLLIEQIKQLWEQGQSKQQIVMALNIKDNTVAHALTKLGIDGKERIKRSAGKYHARQIIQYDKNGKYLNTFATISEAEKSTGASHANIVKVCKGERKTAGGFKWEYKEN